MKRIVHRREGSTGLFSSVFLKGTSSPQFRPFLYGGVALLLGGGMAERLLRVSVGWIAIGVGGMAVVGIVSYAFASGRHARREVERKRAEFFQRFENPDE